MTEHFPKAETSESNSLENLEDLKEKEDIERVFDMVPELADIGSQEQYLEYLKTIFPNSKSQNLLYHGTLSSKNILENGFSKEFLGSSSKSTTSTQGFFFGSSKENSENFLFKDEIEWLAKVIYNFEKMKKENGGNYADIQQKYKELEGKIFELRQHITNLKQKELQKSSLAKLLDNFLNKNQQSVIAKKEDEIKEIEKMVQAYRANAELIYMYEAGLKDILEKRNSNYLRLASSKIEQEDIYDEESIQKAFEHITKQDTQYSPAVLSIKINSVNPSEYHSTLKENPFDVEGKIERMIAFNKIGEQFENRLQASIADGHDSHIEYNTFDPKPTDVYIVYQPEQTHILGSKEDVERFKEFVGQ